MCDAWYLNRNSILLRSLPRRAARGNYYGWVKKIQDVRNFWRTRSAILLGVAVYDFPKSELTNHCYLGPWQFNALQSTLSGLPAFVICDLRPLEWWSLVSKPILILKQKSS